VGTKCPGSTHQQPNSRDAAQQEVIIHIAPNRAKRPAAWQSTEFLLMLFSNSRQTTFNKPLLSLFNCLVFHGINQTVIQALSKPTLWQLSQNSLRIEHGRCSLNQFGQSNPVCF
ncbi:hypothetical protein, partial [Stieleria mannarensis]|uniref:hypothetical protein n=1 Tax=Stieleria mannarensis TaxID=2755585 RepID=UPI001C728428